MSTLFGQEYVCGACSGQMLALQHIMRMMVACAPSMPRHVTVQTVEQGTHPGFNPSHPGVNPSPGRSGWRPNRQKKEQACACIQPRGSAAADMQMPSRTNIQMEYRLYRA